MTSFLDPENVCQRVLEAAGHSGPPTDLRAVCSLWPSLEIGEEELDKEGYLISLGVLGAEILVRKSDPVTRKKFTIAHELGHWMLANMSNQYVSLGEDKSLSLPFQREPKKNISEETWCNRFASCLLMPVRDIQNYLCNIESDNLAATISKGHLVFEVSQEAFFLRIRETTPISVFEVVSVDATVKIRRSFPSEGQDGERAMKALSKFMADFSRADDWPEGRVVVDDWGLDVKLTRKSQYGCAWLVAVVPVDARK